MKEMNYSKINSVKISIIGSASVGKTSICNRIVNNFFTTSYEPTIKIK